MGTPRNIKVLAIAAALLGVASTMAAAVQRGADDRPVVMGSPLVPDVSAPAPVVLEDIPTTTVAPTPVPPREQALSAAQQASRLRKYSSCDAFVAAARREAMARVGPYGLPSAGDSRGPAVWSGTITRGVAGGGRAGEASAGTGSPSTGADAGAPGGHSGTNVQEQGVDEPDLVETDGRRLFTITRGRLWYATIVDGTARIDASLDLPNAQQLVLVGDRAVVFGYRFPRHAGDTFASVITVVDVRSPAMGVVASLVFEGHHVSARVVDGVVRAVVRSSPSGLRFTHPETSEPAAVDAATAHNREVVAKAPPSAWMPPLVVEDGLRRVRSTRSLLDCRATYHPQRFAGFGMLTVLTFDPRRPDDVTTASVHGDGDRVYAGRNRLYVATNGWQSVAGAGREVVPDPETLVHAFDISDAEQARYTSSGRVRGTTIGQFAFSEHNGFLRVATTTWQHPAARDTSESWVTVLRDNGLVLEEVGRVGGLGKDERIYAVRFIGDIGYVVTFRQVDPLYVIDLTNPRAPKVSGELKIEGYSAYLHPIGPGLLLGVGRDATPDGRAQGVQVSVFDVSDPARPTRLHHFALPGTGMSDVEHDHHAFLWWAPANLVVVPAWEARDGGSWHGAVGLTAGRDRLSEVARITHPVPSSTIERTVVVGATVFTVSYAGIAAADLGTLTSRGWSQYPDLAP